jgi:hypothetical protein
MTRPHPARFPVSGCPGQQRWVLASAVPYVCQNERKTTVIGGHPRVTRTASELGMGRLTPWLGEVEGLDFTLTFLRQEREQAKRLTRIAPIYLGIPGARPAGAP